MWTKPPAYYVTTEMCCDARGYKRGLQVTSQQCWKSEWRRSSRRGGCSDFVDCVVGEGHDNDWKDNREGE